jgi:hypothetical protein
MSVLLLQMARAEDVEDLGDLNGARPESEVNPVLPEDEVDPALPSEAGEGSSAAPVSTVSGEGSLPAPAPMVEDPPKGGGGAGSRGSHGGGAFACGLVGVGELVNFVCVTEPWLLRRFKILGLCTQPLLIMLILWRLRPWLLEMNWMILCLSFLSLMILGARLCGRKNLRIRTWIILQPWMWLWQRLLCV